MQKINLSQASKLTSPNPVSLVCTQKVDGSSNLATVSWWTYLSYNPGMIAFAMSKTSFSGETTRLNKKAILVVPGAKLADAVMGCGSVSGRNVDKAAKFGVELVDVENSEIKIPAHSRAAIQCALKECLEVGDHYLYVCNVEQVYGNPDEEALFAWDGYAKIASARQ